MSQDLQKNKEKRKQKQLNKKGNKLRKKRRSLLKEKGKMYLLKKLKYKDKYQNLKIIQ